jgi:hypothetical protein
VDNDQHPAWRRSFHEQRVCKTHYLSERRRLFHHQFKSHNQQTPRSTKHPGNPSTGLIAPHLSGAARAIRRSVFDTFGPLQEDCPTEDSPYLLRSLLLGDGIKAGVTGIKHRKHQNNLSSSSSLASMQFEQISRQYECDLKKAVGLQIANDSILRSAKTWIRERKREHEFRSRETIAPNLRAILWMLRSPRFSRREKLGLMLKIGRHACTK